MSEIREIFDILMRVGQAHYRLKQVLFDNNLITQDLSKHNIFFHPEDESGDEYEKLQEIRHELSHIANELFEVLELLDLKNDSDDAEEEYDDEDE